MVSSGNPVIAYVMRSLDFKPSRFRLPFEGRDNFIQRCGAPSRATMLSSARYMASSILDQKIRLPPGLLAHEILQAPPTTKTPRAPLPAQISRCLDSENDAGKSCLRAARLHSGMSPSCSRKTSLRRFGWARRTRNAHAFLPSPWLSAQIRPL